MRTGELEKKLLELPELPIKPEIVGYADHVNWAPYSDYSAKGYSDLYHDVYSDASFEDKKLPYFGKNIDKVIQSVLINKRLSKKLAKKLMRNINYIDTGLYWQVYEESY